MPLTTLVLFVGVTIGVCWALCFLVSDAHIFGIDTLTTKYFGENDKALNEFLKRDRTGIFKIRQKLLQNEYIRMLFGCYFCLSVWLGVISILIVDIAFDVTGNGVLRNIIFRAWWEITLFVLVVDLFVATCVYVFNLLLIKLENNER